MNVNTINHEAVFTDRYQDELIPLEKVCKILNLHGFCIMHGDFSLPQNDGGKIVHRFVHPACDPTDLPSDEILYNLIGRALTEKGRAFSGLVCFEIEEHSLSRSLHSAVFIPHIEALPGFFALFCKMGDPFLPEELEGIQSVYELAYTSMVQKKTIEVLEREKIKYHHLFSASPEAIVMLDKNNCIIDANPEFGRLFQYTKDYVMGKEVDALLAPGKLYEEAKHLSQSNWRGVEVAVETQRQRRDGTLCDVLVMGVPFYHTNGQLRVFAIYRDISERVKATTQKQQRLAFIEYISGVSSELINTDVKNMDALIMQVLQTVGKSHFAERAYLFMVNEEGNKLEVSHEWAEDTRYAYLNKLPYIILEEVKEYFRFLGSGVIFNLSRNEVGRVEGTAELESFFDLQNIETLLHIPLFLEHSFHGFIGFDTYSRPVKWEDQGVNSLRLTGQILVNALSRKKTEEALKAALVQAKSSDNLKSAFLAGISHEIRTPMNHILGFIELLAENDITEAEKTEFIGIMKKSGMDLLHLIDDVIELAMIDSGQVDIRKEPCELNRFMESLIVEAEGLKSSLHRSNVQIKLRADGGLRNQVILTDEFRLRQIITNMMSNALKYTLEGMVEIGFSRTVGDKIEFYVNDTGIGIQKEEQEVIFERFRRLENGLSRSFAGVGLGLSISQGLANLFDSKITLDSQPGKGSSFRFSIPFLAYEAPQVISTKVLNGSPMYDWSGKTALMVEDDPVNMRFLTVLLLKTNLNLLYASDGREAVEIVETSPVDIVLMDMNLPVLDGYEATRHIKQLKPHLPIIAQTAHALNEDRDNCLKAGCDEYIAKPIDKYRLYSLMDQFFAPKGG